MEPLGTKVVVLGAGGAGCKMLNQLASANPTNAELIAIDTDRAQLQSLNEKVRGIAVGDAIANCKSLEDMRANVPAETKEIEDAVSGAKMAVLFASLGGKAGSHISSLLADLCSKKGIFTLVIAACPLTGESSDMRSIVNDLKEHSGGVVIVDNTPNLGEGVQVQEVFNRINNAVLEFVVLIINSVSGIGYMTMTFDELVGFFLEDFYFVMTFGKGKNLGDASRQAVGDVHKYACPPIRRMLLLTTGAAEAGLDEMRALNDTVQDRYHPESVKWIGAYAATELVDLIVISATADMPAVTAGVPVETALPPAVQEQTAVQADQPTIQEQPAGVGILEPAEKETKIEVEEPAAAGKVGTPAIVESLKVETPEEMMIKETEKPGYFDFSKLERYAKAPAGKPFRSPALVGLRRGGMGLAKKKASDRPTAAYIERGGPIDVYALGKRGYEEAYDPGSAGRYTYSGHGSEPKRGERKPPSENELNEVVDDLMGFPNVEEQRKYYQKPAESQKKMKDYGLNDIKRV